MTDHYDVIVIGSGAGGGTVALAVPRAPNANRRRPGSSRHRPRRTLRTQRYRNLASTNLGRSCSLGLRGGPSTRHHPTLVSEATTGWVD